MNFAWGAIAIVLLASSCSKRADPKKKSGPAEEVTPAQILAERQAKTVENNRRAWLGRTLGLSQCLWAVRDATRGNRVLEETVAKKAGWIRGLSPRHSRWRCDMEVGRTEAGDAKKLVEDLMGYIGELGEIIERVEAYLNERDYLEDGYKALDTLADKWRTVYVGFKDRADTFRKLMDSERTELRKVLNAAGKIEGTRERLTLIALELLDAESEFAGGAGAESVDGYIAKISAARELLRESKPQHKRVLQQTSNVLAALKDLRRDPSRQEQAIERFYGQGLSLLDAVREALGYN